MKYELSKEAKDDLREIHDFLARQSPRVAARGASEITERIEQLPGFPGAHAIPPVYERPRVRQALAGNYRIFYTVGEETEVVTAIVHVRRRL